MNILHSTDLRDELNACGLPPAPGVELVRDVLIQARFSAAYLRCTGQLVPGSVMQRGCPLRVDRRIPLQIPVVNQAVGNIWEMGTVCLLPLPFEGADHFGHLITEVFAALYPLTLQPELRDGSIPVCVGELFWKRSSVLHKLLTGMFRVQVLDQDTDHRVQTLMLPRPTMHNRHSVSAHHVLAMQELLPLVSGDPIKTGCAIRSASQAKKRNSIYLSRSKLNSSKRRILNELELEEQLGKRGWSIVHPQELPLDEQISAMGSAKRIGGAIGSAFHLLMALGTQPADLPNEVRGLSQARICLLNYLLQFQMQKIEASYAVCLQTVPNCGKADVNADLIIAKSQISLVVEWLCSD